jgi:hypothetical protein
MLTFVWFYLNWRAAVLVTLIFSFGESTERFSFSIALIISSLRVGAYFKLKT